MRANMLSCGMSRRGRHGATPPPTELYGPRSGPEAEAFNPNAPRIPTGIPWPMAPSAIEDAKDIVPHWVTGPLQLLFNTLAAEVALANAAFGTTAGLQTRAVWRSPIFDLRPDLKSDNYRPEATSIFGAGGLMVLVDERNGFINAIANDLSVFSLESVHTVNPQELRFFEERKDITADFFDGTEATLLAWEPPAAPIRYWSTVIIFDWVGAPGAEPDLTAWAAAH